MELNFQESEPREPLAKYPWASEIDRLLLWTRQQEQEMWAFCFDVVMSLAFIDATPGIEQSLEHCDNAPAPFNTHMGFINLCALCHEKQQRWIFQKAAKPQSGALGKLSCEIILRFIARLFPDFEKVIAIGGTETADAMMRHINGVTIVAEVKSAPLLTYPLMFSIPQDLAEPVNQHEKITLTPSQLKTCEAGLYMHDGGVMPLSNAGQSLWPFKQAMDFLVDPRNREAVQGFLYTWKQARDAYKSKNKESKYYYLANASGSPPTIARIRDNWPPRESISDSKTSAGMDRTDDIKKGIYQVLKLGSQFNERPDIKTALISNLPAYRHGDEYLSPFIDMIWGNEKHIETIKGVKALPRSKMRRVFDYVITLETPMIRDVSV